MRVFLDANVLISSFSFEGVTRRLVAHLVENHEIIISPQVIDEFRRVSIEKIKVDSKMVDSLS